VQVIDVHRKSEKLVATLLVMRIFSGFLGASRACANFCDSIAESRFDTLLCSVKTNKADGLVLRIFIC